MAEEVFSVQAVAVSGIFGITGTQNFQGFLEKVEVHNALSDGGSVYVIDQNTKENLVCVITSSGNQAFYPKRLVVDQNGTSVSGTNVKSWDKNYFDSKFIVAGSFGTSFTGSFFETATADFTGSVFGTAAVSNSVQLDADSLFNNLVAYWRFNESSGTLVGVNQIATQQNAVLASGAYFDTTTKKLGAAAVHFDGTNDYAFVPAGSVGGVFNFAGSNFSIAFWVYPNKLPTADTQDCMMSYFNQASTLGWVLDLHNFGAQNVRFNLLNGAQFIVETAQTLTVNTWEHLAFVRNNGSSLIYYNGSLLVNGSAAAAGSVNVMLQLGDQGGLLRTLSGLMDDVRVYNTALTAAQVGSIFTESNEVGSYLGVGSYLTTRAWTAGSFYDTGSLIWNATSGTNEFVQAQYRVAGSNAGFGVFSSLNAGSNLVIGSSNIGSVQALFLLSGTRDTTPTLNNWQVDYYLNTSSTGSVGNIAVYFGGDC